MRAGSMVLEIALARVKYQACGEALGTNGVMAVEVYYGVAE